MFGGAAKEAARIAAEADRRSIVTERLFDSHTRECSERYRDQREALDEIKSILKEQDARARADKDELKTDGQRRSRGIYALLWSIVASFVIMLLAALGTLVMHGLPYQILK
jgi:phage host-nuclease inhibitor protein Gam